VDESTVVTKIHSVAVVLPTGSSGGGTVWSQPLNPGVLTGDGPTIIGYNILQPQLLQSVNYKGPADCMIRWFLLENLSTNKTMMVRRRTVDW